MGRPPWRGAGEPPLYAQAADRVRAMIAGGTLKPGQAAPSGAALAKLAGVNVVTARKGLRLLADEGVLEPGPSVNARYRVPGGPGGDFRAAARALSAALAAGRRAAGLTQPQLAVKTGMSVTTVGHAETGRLWHSAGFWERADEVLGTGGDLVRLHAAYRAAARPAFTAAAASPEAAVTAPRVPVAVLIVWSDGTETVMRPQPGPPS